MGEKGGAWPDMAPTWASIINESIKETGRKVDALGKEIAAARTDTAVQGEQISGVRKHLARLRCAEHGDKIESVEKAILLKADVEDLKAIRAGNRVLVILGGALAAFLAGIGAKDKAAEVLRYIGGAP